jgi:hypothetical protein
MSWGERIESVVIDRVHRDELALKMCRKFCDLNTSVSTDSFDLIAISLTVRRFFEIKKSGIKRRDLHALIA